MTHHTPDEVKQRYVDAMGPELGTTFHQLFNECAWLYYKWHDYVSLFGTSESRVELLNKAAAPWFRSIEDSLWNDALLHVCRLTDRPKVAGRQTLTIQRLPLLVDAPFRPEVEKLGDVALEKCKFARDWRNRRIGHRDLRLALDESAEPLAPASRQHMSEALQGIADVLNLVEGHYCNVAPTPYDFASGLGAELLLYVIRDGVEAREDRHRRLASGELRRRADLVQKSPL
jgi:hypothetical protein